MHLTLLSFYSGHVQRGVEVYAQNLKQYLSSSHTVEIISSPAIHWVKNATGLLLRRFYLDSYSRQITLFTLKILKQLNSNPPDILYPLNNGWQSILSKLFTLHHPTKLVLGGHSGLGWDDRINLWLCPDLFICFSHYQQAWAKSVNPLAKTTVISHGVDLDKFSPQGSKAKLNLQQPIFITVSALDKNIQATIKAIAQLNQGSLLLLGNGPDEARIDQLANQFLPDRYQRLSVSHNIISQFYRSADAFTLTSSPTEAFGLVYLEALACNLPVVATDDLIRREIIGSAGIYVRHPSDTFEYTQALKQVTQINWGNKPRQQAEKFSWDKIARAYNSVFHQLINKT